jgi:hypothetical protein
VGYSEHCSLRGRDSCLLKRSTIVQPVFSIGEIGAGEKGQAEGSNVCFSASSLIGRQGGSDSTPIPYRSHAIHATKFQHAWAHPSFPADSKRSGPADFRLRLRRSDPLPEVIATAERFVIFGNNQVHCSGAQSTQWLFVRCSSLRDRRVASGWSFVPFIR